MKIGLRRSGGLTAAVLTLGVAAVPCAAQDEIGATSLTIYSTARPGAVPAELYRPVAGQDGFYPGQSIPRGTR